MTDAPRILTPQPVWPGGVCKSDARTVTRGGTSGNIEVRYAIPSGDEMLIAGVSVKNNDSSARNWSERVLDGSLAVVADVVAPTSLASGAEDGSVTPAKLDAGWSASLLVESVAAGQSATFGFLAKTILGSGLVVTVVNV